MHELLQRAAAESPQPQGGGEQRHDRVRGVVGDRVAAPVAPALRHHDHVHGVEGERHRAGGRDRMAHPAQPVDPHREQAETQDRDRRSGRPDQVERSAAVRHREQQPLELRGHDTVGLPVQVGQPGLAAREVRVAEQPRCGAEDQQQRRHAPRARCQHDAGDHQPDRSPRLPQGHPADGEAREQVGQPRHDRIDPGEHQLGHRVHGLGDQLREADLPPGTPVQEGTGDRADDRAQERPADREPDQRAAAQAEERQPREEQHAVVGEDHEHRGLDRREAQAEERDEHRTRRDGHAGTA